jgi:hypothetical protein
MERKKHTSLKLTVAAIIAALGISSCTTTYDAYGRPVETVDSGAVAIGAVALGIAAYAIGKNNRSSHNDYRGYRGGGYGHYGHHRGHGGGYYRGCR